MAPRERFASGLCYTDRIIALEPKLIYPGLGVVGIENTSLVTDDGLESLTISEEDVIIK